MWKTSGPERTFGIEIEFFASSNEGQIARALQANGLEARTGSYNEFEANTWVVTTDATAEWEVKSPILTGTEGLNQVKIAMKTIRDIGGRVDAHCGLHVHHGVPDYRPHDMGMLTAMYGFSLQQLISQMLPRSRRNNMYCRPLDRNATTHSLETVKGQKEKKIEVDDVMEFLNTSSTYSRYVTLNWQAFQKCTTVEFRQHQGTLNFEKARDWILFTQGMVESAPRKRSNPRIRSKGFEVWDDLYMNDATQMARMAFNNLLRRRQQFAQAEGLEVA